MLRPLGAPDGRPVLGSVGVAERAAGVVRGWLATGGVWVLECPP